MYSWTYVPSWEIKSLLLLFKNIWRWSFRAHHLGVFDVLRTQDKSGQGLWLVICWKRRGGRGQRLRQALHLAKTEKTDWLESEWKSHQRRFPMVEKKIHSYSLICHMDSLESKCQDRIQYSGDLLNSGLEISFCGTAGKEKWVDKKRNYISLIGS